MEAEPSTLVEILRWRALNQPNRLAYTFLRDGEKEEVHLTYADLDRRARAIGARLQSLGAYGERALLVYPQGLEFIAGFFGLRPRVLLRRVPCVLLMLLLAKRRIVNWSRL